MRATAIIVAAGSGERAGGDVPKQFLSVAGRPLLLHTLARFGPAAGIDERIVVLPETADWERHLAAHRPAGDWQVVAGGADRQASVAAGLAVATGALVVVHDGARPLVPDDLIAAVLRAAHSVGAAVAAAACADTVKEVVDGRVRATLDRRRLVLAQTPQAFRADLLRRAHRQADADCVRATDDAALVERIGASVAVVEGPATNIKVTSASDLRLAERLLLARAAEPIG